jgi:nucleoside-diphosphate-sugar epimerase
MPLRSVSILGCGWLGLPLAQKLVASGYTVKGSTTTQAKISVLENSNIIPYHLTCAPSVEGEDVADFFKADALFVNIPFRRNLEDPRFYVEQMRSVIANAAAAGARFVIFAGSTAVYPLRNQHAREDDVIVPSDARAQALLEAEQLFLNDPHFKATVIRFAGLYGPGREIGEFLKTGRVAAKDGNAPVNLIHLDDCIGIISAVLQKKPAGEIFNACADAHPLRKDLYVHAAIAAGLKPQHLAEKENPAYKIIDNAKVKELLSYRFIYPSPWNWINKNASHRAV